MSNKTALQHWGDDELSLDILPFNETNSNKIVRINVSPLVSYYILRLFRLVVDFSLINSLAIFGCCNNFINMIVYLKMGLADTTTINILALSALDLLACAMTLITVVSFSPLTSELRLLSGEPMVELGFGAFIVYYPAVASGAWVTALLSVERCLCIVLPLKVKTLVTVKRTSLLILTMLLYQLAFITVMFVDSGPPYTPSPSGKDRKIYLLFSYSIPSLICFLVICVSTFFLVLKLRSHRNQDWLKRATGSNAQNVSVVHRTAKKEGQAMRLVVLICSLYLVCFAPNALMFLLTTLIVPTMQVYHPYLGNLTNVLFMICTLFQTVSSSVNIFIYYALSSKYRAVLTSLCVSKRQKN